MERKSEGRFSVCVETLHKACNYLWNVNLREGSVFVLRRYRRLVITSGT